MGRTADRRQAAGDDRVARAGAPAHPTLAEPARAGSGTERGTVDAFSTHTDPPTRAPGVFRARATAAIRHTSPARTGVREFRIRALTGSPLASWPTAPALAPQEFASAAAFTTHRNTAASAVPSQPDGPTATPRTNCFKPDDPSDTLASVGRIERMIVSALGIRGAVASARSRHHVTIAHFPTGRPPPGTTPRDGDRHGKRSWCACAKAPAPQPSPCASERARQQRRDPADQAPIDRQAALESAALRPRTQCAKDRNAPGGRRGGEGGCTAEQERERI